MSTIRDDIVKARKDYKCIWCGDGILKGTQYFLHVNKFEGCLNSDKFHIECGRAMQKSPDVRDDGCFYPYSNERGVA